MTARLVVPGIAWLSGACWLAGVLAWATASGSPWDGEVRGNLAALAFVAGAFGLLATLGLILVRAALRLTRRVDRIRPGGAALAVAAAAALAAATPVHVAWDDGCNDHDARLPLIAAPYVLLATPESPYLAYVHDSTLVHCPDLASREPGRGL